MVSLLDHLTVAEHGDFVAEPAGRQPVADVDGRAVAGNGVELLVNLRLGDGVKGSGGFVQNDEGRVLVKCPGNGDLLRLAAGNLHAVLGEVLVEHGVQPLGHGRQPVAEARVHESLCRPHPVVIGAARHIFSQRLGQELEVLEHHGENLHIVLIIILADVNAVQEDFSLLGVVQAAQELNKGGLSAAVFPDDGQPPADLELHGHVFQRPVLPAGVAEGHVAELHLVLPVGALLRGQAALIHGVGDIQELEGGIQKFRIGFQNAHQPGQLKNASRHGGGRAHILGHAAHVKRAAPGLQAGKHVHKAGDQRHNARTQCGIDAHGSLRNLSQPAVGTKGRIAVPVGRHQILLVVHPDVRAPSLFLADKAEGSKQAVAHGGVLRRAAPVGNGLFVAFSRQNADENHAARQSQNEQGVIQDGQLPGGFRHRGGKQGDRQRNAA